MNMEVSGDLAFFYHHDLPLIGTLLLVADTARLQSPDKFADVADVGESDMSKCRRDVQY